jgi:signal transduction histidine kinase
MNASRLPALLTGLTLGRVLFVTAAAVLVALFLDSFFTPPLLEVIGRTTTVALLALLAFTVAGNWRQKLLPTWVMQLLAIGVAIPLTTLAIYLTKRGGDLQALLSIWPALTGMAWIAGSGLFWGLLFALVALYRERDAQARARELQWELDRSTLQRQALDAQLRVLQAQIEPHFLFNTLANVQALVEAGSPCAARVLANLVTYLKAAMQHARRDRCTLAEECDLVHAYLEVMQLRMPDRLRLEINLPADLREVVFIPLALLTLVENAVRHGIDPSEDGGAIHVSAQREGAHVRVSVADTGRGLLPNAVPGTGLDNVRQRLKTRFGDEARLELTSNMPRGVVAALLFEPPASSVLAPA